tara:strand:+ start:231 stop:791 length:561 start_codon:yes stop_codon:yes gene_type:complete
MLNKVTNALGNHGLTIVYVLIGAAVFIGVSIYVYLYYIKPQFDKTFVENKEFITEGSETSSSLVQEKGATFVLLKTTWCPYCKNLLKKGVKSDDSGVWVQITSGQNNMTGKKTKSGHTIQFYEIDGDDKDAVESFEKQYNVKVDGYPTIYLIKDDQIIEFDAKPTVESIKNFVESTLGGIMPEEDE